MTMRRVKDAYIADTARVLGDVELGKDVSIWYGVAIRGDVAKIVIGEGTNVQDNTVIHCDHGHPNVIGRFVTIGHAAVLHGEEVGEGTLVGIGARLLGHTKIGKNCLIAAGAVVPPGLVVPDGMLVMGVPAKVVRETSEKEKEYLRILPPRYIEMAQIHAAGPADPRVKPYGG